MTRLWSDRLRRTGPGIFVLLVTSWFSVYALPAEGEHDEHIVTNRMRFELNDAAGGDQLASTVTAVRIDDLAIGVIDVTVPSSPQRLYRAGKPIYGNVTFQGGCSAESLRRWLHLQSRLRRNRNLHVNATITLFRSDGMPGRAYTLVDLRPIDVSGCNEEAPRPAADALPTLNATFAPQRIGFWSPKPGPVPPKPPANPWFRLQIGEPGRTVRDDDWELLVGGAQAYEDPPLVLGKIDPGDSTIDTKPHSSCAPLTLRGPVTDGREWLTRWLNDATLQRVSSRDLFVAAAVPGAFSDALPIGYAFPKMAAADTGEPAIEEVRIKPMRCELQ